ncbi:MAG: hypothetical protein LBN34_09795 [Clostridiales Family XIII bacterium]|jgi:hypothetical protein|nr:hypothetical protein [Clostridiales Family XIII bacterium]
MKQYIVLLSTVVLGIFIFGIITHGDGSIYGIVRALTDNAPTYHSVRM